MNSKKNKLSATSLSRLGGLLPNILLGCMMLFSVSYNPQNEMLAFCKTKCSIRKTKRIFLIIPS